MKVLETERLILREFTPGDRDEFSRIITDKETMKFFPSPYKEEHVIKWIEFCINGYKELGHSFWAVIRKSDGLFLGDCGITIQEIDGEELPEVGYHFNKLFWGKGYATEAATACIEYGFRKLGFNNLYSYMTRENTPSQKVAKKAGMKLEKTYKDGEKTIDVYKIEKAHLN